jgi:tyrosyl-tRNA synthetase
VTAKWPASLLKRGVAEVIIEQEMVKLLESGRPLRLKQGFDPSRPDIHLGHVVGLRKLREFQEMGHQVILIVGDWTAQIGDPSGQSITRPMLTAEEVKRNAESYMQQFFKVVDKSKTQVRLQSEWFGKFTLADIIKLTSKFTVAQFLAREDFRKRFDTNQPIAITELLYPLLQAYDSVAIEADVEFGGMDQKFNCLVGRELQGMMGQRQQQVFLMPLLVGTDGVQKMSKSLGNYIAVDEPPYDMYGKVMSVPDNLITLYFELLTDIPDKELAGMKQQLEAQSVNPMDLKKLLALDIVTQFHDASEARKAEQRFEKLHQRRDVTIGLDGPVGVGVDFEPIVVTTTDETLLRALVDILVLGRYAKSRGEAKRLISQGAVDVDGAPVTDLNLPIKPGSVLKVGKHRFGKVRYDVKDG